MWKLFRQLLETFGNFFTPTSGHTGWPQTKQSSWATEAVVSIMITDGTVNTFPTIGRA